MRKKIFLNLLFVLILLTVNAMATDSTGYESKDMTTLLCTAFQFLTGNVGKTLAAFACVGFSLAFVGGKVAWTSVLAFSLGMACIFGAPQIVKMIAGGDKPCEKIN